MIICPCLKCKEKDIHHLDKVGKVMLPVRFRKQTGIVAGEWVEIYVRSNEVVLVLRKINQGYK